MRAFRLQPFALAAALAAALCAAAVRAGEPDWRAECPAEVREGDIVLRRGDGIWTRFFVNASERDRRFSHVGIAVTAGKSPVIVHAEADDSSANGFVKAQPWSEFHKGSFMAGVYRIPGPEPIGRKIAEAAKKRIGTPFDPLFRLDDESRLYCSQLVRDAVNEAAGKELVRASLKNGTPIVAIDACYLGFAEKIFEAGEPPAERFGAAISTRTATKGAPSP